MGYALAHACLEIGARVILISGPVNERIEHPSLHVISVTSADEMYHHTVKHWKKADIGILSAAVADFKPVQVAKQKIKKEGNVSEIKLEPTKDILAQLGKSKTKKQKLIGFALETENSLANAIRKLKNKNLDFIVLNTLNESNQVFGSDYNSIEVVDKKGKHTRFNKNTKRTLAEHIIKLILAK